MNDIIIPPPQAGRPYKYDFHKLERYGDSVLIEGDNVRSIRDCAYKYAQANGIKVATRKEGSAVRVYHAGDVD